jgi:cellulose synthase/poly-beta-1,6-N-acetylglucosamine synthase-like glycosyltransferase
MKITFAKPHRIAFTIFACNESTVIKNTVFSIRDAIHETDALFVIADNCFDQTAQLAAEAGAKVFTRTNDRVKGKGAAIRWFVQMYWEILREYDEIVILDADSLLPKDFIEKLEPYLNQDFQVGQCFLQPENYKGSQISTLIALSELLEQSVFDPIRAFFGFSVRLRGTGMVFKPQLLLDLCRKIDTEVEDIVFSLLLAEQKVIVKHLKSASVYDPKPTAVADASKQRARWFRGQNTALWKYRNDVIRTSLSGLNGWSVLLCIFFKPRWLQLLILAILGLLSIQSPYISGLFFSIVIVEAMLMFVGFLKLKNRKEFSKALFFVPVFILMWVKGIFLSFQKLPWLRVRKVSNTLNDYVLKPKSEELIK